MCAWRSTRCWKGCGLSCRADVADDSSSRRPVGQAAQRAFRARVARHRADVFALGRRTRLVVLFAALTGALTGLGVAGFESLIRAGLFDHLRRAPVAVQVVAPLGGLVLAAAALRYGARGATPATADEYIRNFHQPGVRLGLRAVPGRLLASVATLGLGGALGYEGPSIYLGAAVGSALQRRFSRLFSREDAKVLLVAGAAAGVAAIFKAPLTGLVFALEVPYQGDFARRMLLPAGIAAAVSYVVFVAIAGTAPLFAVSGAPPFDLRDLGGAALLGVCCGVGARLFTTALVRAKGLAARLHPALRAVGAGSVLVALAAIAKLAFGAPLTLGAGYDNLTWAFDPRRAVALVLLLFVLRALATVATVSGGGVGGLFIPLVIEGALLGRATGGLFRTAASGSNFFPLVGVSAFLGAGYRVPLAGVVFAAEATGRPGFIVPGLIAAMVAQLFMGRASASPYQVAARAGHLERRFALPLTAAMRTDVATMPADTTLAEFFRHHLLGNREKAVAVVDAGRYLGVMRIEELQAVAPDQWATEQVGEHMRTDFPVVNPGMLVRDALTLMEEVDVDLLPVLDGDTFVGVVTTTEILKLDEILGETRGEP
jgi:chloride channel protein, CIC family